MPVHRPQLLASGRTTCTIRPLCNYKAIQSIHEPITSFFLRDSRLSFDFFPRIPIFDRRYEGKRLFLSLSSFPVSDQRRLCPPLCWSMCWLSSRGRRCTRGQVFFPVFLPPAEKSPVYIYSGLTRGWGGERGLLGVQKLRVDARIGLRTISIHHRSRNSKRRCWKSENRRGLFQGERERERERERNKNGGQVKTVSLPGAGKKFSLGTERSEIDR